MRAIPLIKLVQQAGPRKLSEAKDLVDALLGGHPFTLQFESAEQAVDFAKSAEKFGAICREITD